MIGAAATAPTAPGRLGEPVDPPAFLHYLQALHEWRRARRSELDLLDRTALGAKAGAEVTGDIALSLALWKAASDRCEELQRVWDSGRLGLAERERLSTLIWGRLDSSKLQATGLNLSLPEACRLSDALAGQLRVRLGLELSGAEVTARLSALRAQLERIREQIDTEPAGSRQQEAAAQQSRLARRLRDVTEKAERGGDVGGMLEPLEIEATTFERDLIVGAARRREASAKVAEARRRRDELNRHAGELQKLVQRCLTTVEEAPHYAVPDVEAIGPVPNTLTALEAYLQRLDRVERAMSVVREAYSEPLARHSELVDRLEAYRAKAEATGQAGQPEVVRTYELARDTLQRRPAPLAVAEQLVAAYSTYLRTGSARSEVS
jgi:hypothetical protein